MRTRGGARIGPRRRGRPARAGVGLLSAALLGLAAAPAQAAFPGANGRITFDQRIQIDSEDAYYSDGALVSLASDGSDRRVLLDDRVWEPNYSADGSKIVYDFQESFAVANADGSGRYVIPSPYVANFAASWAPSGDRIVFIAYAPPTAPPAPGSDPEAVADVHTMRLDGTDLRRLTFGPKRDWGPRFSPDGRHIAHETEDSQTATGLSVYRMRADGSGRVRLATNAGDPDWSPDGSRLTFTRRGSTGKTEIWTMRADGSDKVRVGYGRYPVYSPDGRKILASDYNRGLFTIPAGGGTPSARLFTDSSTRTGNATWQPLP